jgi:radical SAM superfamily enzyme YgiQ (UPF0313 family)
MRIVLLSCYELGHQPHGLAVPLAFLARAGHTARAQDLAVERLDEELIRAADFVGISVPMHTALRIGARVAARVRVLNPRAHLCCFGLYGPLNEAYLRACGADSVLGGEHEAALVELVERLAAGDAAPRQSPVVLARLDFPAPQRAGLLPLNRYAKLVRSGGEHLAGYTEASRGCLHRCRHCPIPPVYGGRFFVVDAASVLADVAAQVELGAEHITFGDPDFFNGLGHGLAIVRELHRRWPDVTFDVTIKISHLLRRRDHLPELAALGCAFVVSAVESVDDGVLARLDKGHTRADVETALALTRTAGLVLRPTFVPFTPWTTLDQIADLVDFIDREDLAGVVDPVQLSIRLLVPPGSLLLDHDREGMLGALDPAALSHRWVHADPRVDRLQVELASLAADAAEHGRPAGSVFATIREIVHRAAGRVAAAPVRPPRPPPPRLTESWFC